MLRSKTSAKYEIPREMKTVENSTQHATFIHGGSVLERSLLCVNVFQITLKISVITVTADDMS